MSWATKFQTWKSEGKSIEWLTSRLDALHNGEYINDNEYNEILAIINS